MNDNQMPPRGDATNQTPEQRIAVLEQTVAELRAERDMLRAVMDGLPYAIYWKDPDLIYKGCNLRFAQDLGLDSTAAIVGLTDGDLPWQPGEADAFEAADRKVLDTQQPIYNDNETATYADGSQEWFETYKMPITVANGAAMYVLATYNNITARKRAEATVQNQQLLLQELSTPIIPISERILVMPLIGTLNAQRVQQAMETSLERIVAEGAELLILDITGVPVVDTQVAHALIQTGRAVQLLGAQLMLTGIRPEVAQALVGLGIDLRDVTTYGSLQQGLADALHLAE